MISGEVENRITRYYFHNYIPTRIREKLESLLLPYFLEDDEPDPDEMVRMAINFINDALLD